MISVRRALPGHAAKLATLRWDFRSGRAVSIEDEAAFIERCTVWMRRAFEPGGAWQCWVACDNDRDGPTDRIVGQVWLQVLTKIPNPVGERDRHAYISNLYVVPESRGGVGGRLLAAALEWASQQGVDRVVLWPAERSTALYARHGFVRPGDVMELKL
jgi:GNAT superfamily N-acetyltransferase